jgi:hypothetical protein
VYNHPQFLLIGLHAIGCKRKLFNFNQCNLKIYISDQHFCAHVSFCNTFRKVKFCGVPSGAIVKVGCAAGKKRLRIAELGSLNSSRIAISQL